VLYGVAFFAFLFLPLAIVAVFAFNDAPYPAPPWRGFTLDWFLGGAASTRRGLFADSAMLGSLWTSVVVASWVTVLSVLVGYGQCVSCSSAPTFGASRHCRC
jgi:spermidine/putrescine transport system permease protein